MMVLVSYDVRTSEPGGARRLRRVAKVCRNFGQRVQFSVFECLVDPAQWVRLRQQLIDEIDQEADKAFERQMENMIQAAKNQQASGDDSSGTTLPSGGNKSNNKDKPNESSGTEAEKKS